MGEFARQQFAGGNGSYHIAGLAYDANTVDIRPDDLATSPQTKGKQTVPHLLARRARVRQPTSSNNQYYLAAKYGGFKVPEELRTVHAEHRHRPVALARGRQDGRQRAATPSRKPDTYYTVIAGRRHGGGAAPRRSPASPAR
ncbi:MAG: hypothetical protein MZW92_55530 [Comamonadaceae bacterium]|nr:hypothetical protein [Comamonadaceae bacterium]